MGWHEVAPCARGCPRLELGDPDFALSRPVSLIGPFKSLVRAVMKEKDALSEPPERRSPELSRRCLTLTDAVSESIPAEGLSEADGLLSYRKKSRCVGVHKGARGTTL